ncbi:EcsC family protein [Desulfobacterales bacterium HSG2]|nr:EcsC family protein [Desulfobacterales bacterium HSG2]
MKLSETDMEDLAYAKKLLEYPGIAATIMNVLGIPFEQGIQALPEKWVEYINNISEKALYSALDFAVLTLGKNTKEKSSDMVHKIAVAGSGCVGGLFGLPALAIELPISTTIILRSVADIAGTQGEDINNIQTKLACLEVFAFCGRTKDNDSAGTSYYAAKAALSRAVSEASAYIAEHGIAEAEAPFIVRMIANISSRFGIAVSEKTVASAVPVTGSAGGAIINTIFINHFQNMARGHFIIRRLEREYGTKRIEAEYRENF